MTQQHVVPTIIARGMFEDAFHGGDKSNAMTPTGSKWITWLVGPIVCEHCGSVGTEPDAVDYACTRCDGLGYPPTVEIVSLRKVSEIGRASCRERVSECV